jgi:hypothetical protein
MKTKQYSVERNFDSTYQVVELIDNTFRNIMEISTSKSKMHTLAKKLNKEQANCKKITEKQNKELFNSFFIENNNNN